MPAPAITGDSWCLPVHGSRAPREQEETERACSHRQEHPSISRVAARAPDKIFRRPFARNGVRLRPISERSEPKTRVPLTGGACDCGLELASTLAGLIAGSPAWVPCQAGAS